MKKNNVGRPLKVKTPQEMLRRGNEYFELCNGEILKDSDGNFVFNKYGMPCFIKPPKPPSIVGMALHLGFLSRQSFIDYEKRPEFSDTVIYLKSRVEEYVDGRLYDKEGARGAIFNLQCNFNWGKEDTNNITKIMIVDDIPETDE